MTFVLGLAQCRHPEDGGTEAVLEMAEQWCSCLLYTSDAADEL